MTSDKASRSFEDSLSNPMNGGEIVLQALRDNAVEHIFGYPGAAVLPIYDEIFQQDDIKHYLVRHEQGAGHAAQGYARSTGKVGVMLVTSGPGVTNAITPLQDALADSTPIVCLCGQVPTTLIGTDAFQECDTVGITRPCTKYNILVNHIDDLAKSIHLAFKVATSGRPGPVLVDMPKDVLFASGEYVLPDAVPSHAHYRPAVRGDHNAIRSAVALMTKARRPVLYIGGGVTNAGPEAWRLLRTFAELTDVPVTSTLMGLGAYPASGSNWLQMAGEPGSHAANRAIGDCDLLIAVGARLDGLITQDPDARSPCSRTIQVDIDAAAINKRVPVDIGIQGNASHVLAEMIRTWNSLSDVPDRSRLQNWWAQIDGWRTQKSSPRPLAGEAITPQHALERLHALTKMHDPTVTAEMGQQIVVAQIFGFERPNRFITSGGLATMGFGLPAALGAQIANPGRLVIAVTGDASVQTTIKELSSAIQHQAPIKIFILRGEHPGGLRGAGQVSDRKTRTHAYRASVPDFAELAKAYGAVGLRCEKRSELDPMIEEMIETDRPVVFDCRVARGADDPRAG